MPPMPPKPTRVADVKARFHWPRMLLASVRVVISLLFSFGGKGWRERERRLTVSEDCRDVGICADCREEDAEVAGAVVFGEAEEREANEADDGVGHDNWCSLVGFIGVHGLEVHDDCCEDVWGCYETLGCGDAEAHS